MKDSTLNSKNSKAMSILTSISMLILLLPLTLPLVFSNLNSSCNLMQEIIQIIKDTKGTTTHHSRCIFQETIMLSQTTISNNNHYSRTLLNINRCSKHSVVLHEVETVVTKKEEGEVVTINSEQSSSPLN